jgi:hypothetical protein
MDTDLQTPTTLVQPTAVVPAAIAQYVPPPQPVHYPAGSPAAVGVVIGEDGVPYYGRPPIVFAQPSPVTDPRVAEGIAQAARMAGGGVFAAGAGFGLAEVLGAASGASVGGLIAAAALVLAAKAKAPKRITVHQQVTENYDQRVFAAATGMFGRANGTISNEKTSTTNIS